MAPADGARRAGLGWLILAAALAVPGFLFYNWWSHLKSEHDRGVAAKARSRAAEGSVFQTQPASLARPVVSSGTAPVAPSGGAAPGAIPGRMPAVPGAAPVKATAAAAPNAAPNSMSSTAPGAMPAAVPAPQPGAIAPLPAVSSGAATSSGVSISSVPILTLSRDPMMSPMDTVRLREAEMERLRNEEAIRQAKDDRGRKHTRAAKKEPPIESRIELQGIVARPDGDNLAIVNGSTVNPGESFAVDGFAAKVKVLRITSSEVTFEYKNKHFKKSVNAE